MMADSVVPKDGSRSSGATVVVRLFVTVMLKMNGSFSEISQAVVVILSSSSLISSELFTVVFSESATQTVENLFWELNKGKR